MLVFATTADDTKELFLHFGCNGSAAAATDGYLVDTANWRDFSSCSGEENFVCDVEKFSSDGLLMDGEAKILADLDGDISGNSRKNGRTERGSMNDSVFDKKDVLAAPLTDVSRAI